MDDGIFENLATRLEISSKRVIQKAQELNRLATLKTSCGVTATLCLSGSCLAVICLDLAATASNMTINKELAVRLSGVRKKVYQNALLTYERILDLQSNVTVRDVALQFGCLQVIDLAQKVLQSYDREMRKRLSASVCEGFDLSQPMFAAASVYATCKKTKIRIDKRKILDAARCKKTTFDKLCSDLDRHAEKLLVGINEKSTNPSKRSVSLYERIQENIHIDETAPKRPKLSSSSSTSDESNSQLSFEEWRKQILDETERMDLH